MYEIFEKVSISTYIINNGRKKEEFSEHINYL